MKHNSNTHQEIQEELEVLSPLLAQMRREEAGLKVPENYFDYLSNSVLEQVKLEPKPTIPDSKQAPTWYQLFGLPRLLAGLATVAVLLSIAIFINEPAENLPAVADISTQALETYIADNIDEFETDLFLEETLIESLSEVELNAEEMEEYLESNIEEIDESTLEQLL